MTWYPMTLQAMQETLNYTLFNDIVINEQIDKDILEACIIRTASNRSTIYQNANRFKYYSDMFFRQHKYTIDELVDTLHYDYNPIHNYDRHEEFDDKTTRDLTSNVTDTSTNEVHNTQSTTSKDTNSGTDTHTLTNSETSGGTDKNVNSGTSNVAHTGEDRDKHQGVDSQQYGGNDKTVSTAEGTGSDTLTGNTTNTDSVAAFNSSAFQNQRKSVSDNTSSTNTSSSTDTTSTTTHDRHDSTTFNSEIVNTYDSHDNRTDSFTDTTTYGKTLQSNGNDELNYGHVIDNTQSGASDSNASTSGHSISTDTGDITTKHTAHLYGNIGVTTTQQMIDAQRAIVQFDIYQLIADMWCDELLVGVYINY